MTRLATSVAASALLPAALAAASRPSRPKPLEPRHVLKPPAGEGYFDDVFAIDADGKRLAVIRTDGATFSKLEIFDTGVGQADWADSTCPTRACSRSRWSCSPETAGVVIVGRDKPDDLAPLYAFRFDGAGKPAGKVGPATAFGRPPADGTARARLLVAFTRKLGDEGRRGDLHGRALRRRDAGARRQAARPQGRRHRRAEAAGRALHRLLRRLHARAQRTPGRLRQGGRRAVAVQDGDRRRASAARSTRKGRSPTSSAGPRPASCGRSTSAVRCSSSSMRTGQVSM